MRRVLPQPLHGRRMNEASGRRPLPPVDHGASPKVRPGVRNTLEQEPAVAGYLESQLRWRIKEVDHIDGPAGRDSNKWNESLCLPTRCAVRPDRP